MEFCHSARGLGVETSKIWTPNYKKTQLRPSFLGLGLVFGYKLSGIGFVIFWPH